MKELAAALSAAQAEFPPIERSRTVKVRTKTGADYSFNYAPLDLILEKVRPALSANGLSVAQLLTHVDERMAIRTILLHSSGELLEDVFPIPAAPLTAPQELGAIITYCRRYAVVAVLGIATEEDDERAVARRRARPAEGEPSTGSTPAAASGTKPEGSPAASSSAGQGEGGSQFRAPTGPRGGQSAQLEADEIAAELRQLVEELNATDSLPKIEEKRLEADITWLKRQRTTAQNSLARRAAEANS